MDRSVFEAAQRLGISRQRVLALIDRGELPARRIGSLWVLDDAAIEARLQEPTSAGRPMAPRAAWGMLALLQGSASGWLRNDERSRLRSRLRRRPSIEQVQYWSKRRSELLWLRGHSAALPRLLAFPGALPAGASAPGHDILDLGLAEIYLSSERTPDALAALALRPVLPREANALIRIPREIWPFQGGQTGKAVVALDLWESGDDRSRHSAQALYGALLDEYFPAQK